MSKWTIYAIGLPVVCCLVVIGWFWVCVASGNSSDAGRGGAVGVIMSFTSLFLLSVDRYHSIEVLDKSSKRLFAAMGDESTGENPILPEQNAVRISAIKSDLRRARTQTNWENVSLSVSGGISTFFWGFGDWVALLLIQ